MIIFTINIPRYAWNSKIMVLASLVGLAFLRGSGIVFGIRYYNLYFLVVVDSCLPIRIYVGFVGFHTQGC